MQRTFLSLAAAAAIASTAAMLPTQANAMGVGTAAAIELAIADSSLIEDVRYVCRHRWRTSGRRCFMTRPAVVCRHRGWNSRRVCVRRW